jgi:hypothetical protein
MLQKIKNYDLADADWKMMSFHYSENQNFDQDKVSILKFNFPYIHSAYDENANNVLARILDQELKNTPTLELDQHWLTALNGDVVSDFQTKYGNLDEENLSIPADMVKLFPNFESVKGMKEFYDPLLKRPKIPQNVPLHHSGPLFNYLIELLKPSIYLEISGKDESLFCFAATTLERTSPLSNLFFVDDYSKVNEKERYMYPFTIGGFREFLNISFLGKAEVMRENDIFSKIKNGKLDCISMTFTNFLPNFEEIIERWSLKISENGTLIIHGLRTGVIQNYSISILETLKNSFDFIDFGISADIIVFFYGKLDENKMKLYSLKGQPEFENFVEVGLSVGKLLTEIHDANFSGFSQENSLLKERISAIENSITWRFFKPYCTFRN